MSLYILSDKTIKSFLPSMDDRYAKAALALNQCRVKTRILKKADDVYSLTNDPNAMLFITTTFSTKYYQIIKFCNINNIPVIFSHEDRSLTADYTYSTIKGNTNQTIKLLLAYSEYYNKTRPAFFALNSFSSHDRKKASLIYELCKNFSVEDIFSRDHSFNDCLENFFQNRHKYDVIFCSNDFSAIALIEELKIRDPEYLNNTFILGFMDTIISRLYSPSITSCTYVLEDVTKALLSIYRILYKSNHVTSIDIQLNSKITTRQSTNNSPINSAEINQLSNKYESSKRKLNINPPNTNQRGIPESPIIEICKEIESMLISFKNVDFRILFELLNNKSYPEICDKLFISLSTLQYHLKKMMNALDLNTKSAFLETISKYIDINNLENFIKENQK